MVKNKEKALGEKKSPELFSQTPQILNILDQVKE